MRQEILNWDRKKNEKHWEPFLKFFETAPVTKEEYNFILKKEKDNDLENLIRHSKSHFDPVRKCLNSIYSKGKFVEQDLTKIDDNFLNGKTVNFKIFLDRIEKYPISQETFNRLIDSPNTTEDYNKYKQNIIKLSQRIINIANRLHRQDKVIQPIFYTPAEKISSDLERQVIKSKDDNPSIRKDRLSQASKIPEKIQMTTVGFKRNPDVVAEALLRANGVCEKCNKNAPFIRKKGNTPYLEVHHRVMLSDGGEDTVENAIAVCPNCHRELHFGM